MMRVDVFACILLFLARTNYEGVTARLVPFTPCPELFNYFESQTWDIFGAMTFENDLSGHYELEVHMSIATVTDKGLSIRRVTDDYNIQQGQRIEYYVGFPYNHTFPKMTSVVFNGKEYCRGPPEEANAEHGVTALSKWDSFTTKIAEGATRRPSTTASLPPSTHEAPAVVEPRLVPFTPCPKLFNYFESQTREIFGAMTFANDLSGRYELVVNMSIATTTDKGINIRRITDEYNVQQGQGIEYYVTFPYNHTFPKVTSIVFNGNEYCIGPPEVANDDHGVTALSKRHSFATKIADRLKKKPSTTHPVIVIDSKVHNEPDCGINIDYVPLVFRGHSTRSGEYPWLVALFLVEWTGGYRFICGGSLVSKTHVITAAHCMKDLILGTDVSREDIFVVLGKHNIKNWARGSTIRAVKEYDIHPDYRNPADYDIAIILLDEAVDFGITIRAICLWDESSDNLDDLVNSMGTVAGWGRDGSGKNTVEEPRQIQLPIVSQETCLRSDPRFRKLTSDRTFCAGSINETRGPCDGDSGSGFVVNRGGIWKLRGIVSIALLDPSSRMCDVNNYIVFSDVPKYMTWIKKVLKKK